MGKEFQKHRNRSKIFINNNFAAAGSTTFLGLAEDFPTEDKLYHSPEVLLIPPQQQEKQHLYTNVKYF